MTVVWSVSKFMFWARARSMNRRTASASSSGPSRHSVSPYTPSGSRLVARTRTPGQREAATRPVRHKRQAGAHSCRGAAEAHVLLENGSVPSLPFWPQTDVPSVGHEQRRPGWRRGARHAGRARYSSCSYGTIAECMRKLAIDHRARSAYWSARSRLVDQPLGAAIHLRRAAP
jgi:hypothetical protein